MITDVTKTRSPRRLVPGYEDSMFLWNMGRDLPVLTA